MGTFSNSTRDLAAGYLRLRHKWRLIAEPHLPAEIAREFIRPAIDAVPRSMARRLPLCVFLLVPAFEDEGIASRWTEAENRLELTVFTGDIDPHDVALELLVCLGQALWERATPAERTGWLRLLRAERGWRHRRNRRGRIASEARAAVEPGSGAEHAVPSALRGCVVCEHSGGVHPLHVA
jgi:hypothetical protein